MVYIYFSSPRISHMRHILVCKSTQSSLTELSNTGYQVGNKGSTVTQNTKNIFSNEERWSTGTRRWAIRRVVGAFWAGRGGLRGRAGTRRRATPGGGDGAAAGGGRGAAGAGRRPGGAGGAWAAAGVAASPTWAPAAAGVSTSSPLAASLRKLQCNASMWLKCPATQNDFVNSSCFNYCGFITFVNMPMSLTLKEARRTLSQTVSSINTLCTELPKWSVRLNPCILTVKTLLFWGFIHL